MALFKTVTVLSGFMILVAIIMIPSIEGNPITDCWETWSRCSRWSSPATGILWQSCEDRCKCLGYATGTCREVPSRCPLTDKAWQCQCSGTLSGPKPENC
uniref:Theromacin n=1 Tax=Sinohyriopsis cumingii TaxID=165450 RepID=F8RIZ9_SINCU|nr:theromacin [Sinohyriopsis cumingii]